MTNVTVKTVGQLLDNAVRGIRTRKVFEYFASVLVLPEFHILEIKMKQGGSL